MKKPLYTPDDLAVFSPFSETQDLGRPGEFPFTRGIHPSMYRGRLWTMRQYAGFGSAAESNARYKFLLSQGQKSGQESGQKSEMKALSVGFDLPTQITLSFENSSFHYQDRFQRTTLQPQVASKFFPSRPISLSRGNM